MVTSGTPRRRNRGAQYFDLGVQGRKTGITLREGARDDLGVEAIDGIFSSPTRSPQKPTRSPQKARKDVGRAVESPPESPPASLPESPPESPPASPPEIPPESPPAESPQMIAMSESPTVASPVRKRAPARPQRSPTRVREWEIEERPAKRIREEVEETEWALRPSRPPLHRDPNLLMKRRQMESPAMDETPPRRKRGRPPKSSGTVGTANGKSRSAASEDDVDAPVPRGERAPVRPVNYLQSERPVNTTSRAASNHVSTQPAVPGKRGRGRPKGSKNKPKPPIEQEPLEPWEEEPGIITAPVTEWDPDASVLDPEVVEADIAYAARAIETREVPNSSFRYAKTLTLPFFGSGVVDLPPGGVKRPKNSRKMQMVFYVVYGKVLVDVAGTTFRIGPGGMWQVPRGE
ncbi:MAG: hypothetical protein M1838_000157 [Thelocarpon superellum]|nr:MAG: hypothetical protein M1838_000157 [Thelocarpon superellum]